MQLYRWSYRRLHVPMIEDGDGKLWCTSGILCSALMISEPALRMLYHANREKFSGNCVSGAYAIEFLRSHRVEFGLNYVRGDMRLWSVRDMIKVAFLSRSKVAIEFTDCVVDLIEEHASRSPITLEQYEQLAARLAQLEAMVAEAQPSLASAASAAGTALVAHRGLKILKGSQ
jgi:hypothetical protein